jgi:mannose-6-phosphate isomerase-like protein (cupin superfamily)
MRVDQRTATIKVPRVHTRETLPDRQDWVEVHDFEKFTIDQTYGPEGVRQIAPPSTPNEFVIVLSGEVVADWDVGHVTLRRRDWMEVPPQGLKLTCLRGDGALFHSEVMRVCGEWNDINICTIFQYRPDRDLEMHYHDFHEYWIIFRGHFEGAFDEETHDFVPGEVLVIPAGHEHGTRRPAGETIEGIGFSTTRMGRCRQGHLHRDVDGDPVPL